MAKKVTIEGSNLLQNLNDDWGGVNNSQGSVTPYSEQGASTPVPAGAEWGVNRGELERFLKEQLGKIDNRVGHFEVVQNQDLQNVVAGFKDEDAYDEWRALSDEDKWGEAGQAYLITSAVLPSAQGQDAYMVTMTLEETPDVLQANRNVTINVKGTSRVIHPSGQGTEDITEDLTIVIQTKTSSSPSIPWQTRAEISIPANSSSYTPISLQPYLTDGNNYIRIRAVGMQATSIWKQFTLNVVNLNLSLATPFDAPFTGDTLVLRYLVSGAINKNIQFQFGTGIGSRFNEIYGFDRGTEQQRAICNQNVGESVETSTGLSYEFTDSTMLSNILSDGVHTVRARLYVSESIKSDWVENQYLVNRTNASTPFVAINNYVYMHENWTEVKLFDWAAYTGGSSPLEVHFALKDDNQNTYLEWTFNASDGVAYPFTTQIGIEVDSALTTFGAMMHITDSGGNALADPIPFAFGNSAGNQPKAGADFILNPSARNNAESHPDTIINAKNGTVISSEFSSTFGFVTDGWMEVNKDVNSTAVDAEKVRALHIPANRLLKINYNPFSDFATLAPHNNKYATFELDFRTSNIVDDTEPILRIQASDNDLMGFTLKPTEAYLLTSADAAIDDQNVSWAEDRRTRLTVHVQYNINGAQTPGAALSLVRIFLDGIIEREFFYNAGGNGVNGDRFTEANAAIWIGSTSADIDIFSIRCYKDANNPLSVRDVMQNYKATLSTAEEKTKFNIANDILDDQGRINWDKCKEKYNVIGHIGHLPKYGDEGKGKTNGVKLEIHILDDETGNEDTAHSGTLTNLTAQGQGTTAMGYYDWNQQYKINSNTVFTPVDESITPTTGKGYAIMDGEAKAKKLVGKINFASSMQSHKLGLTWIFNDLFKYLVEHRTITQPSQMEEFPEARIAVFEKPFLFFHKENESDANWTFKYLMTFGAGKGDKPTFGYKDNDYDNDTMHTGNMLMVEGANNDRPLALFQVPWNDDVTYSASDEAWMYNGNKQLNYGLGEVDENTEIPSNTTAINAMKAFFNFAYLHYSRLEVFSGNLSALKASSNVDITKMYWVTANDSTYNSSKYDLFRYDVLTGTWVDAGITKISSGKYEKLNLLTQYNAICSELNMTPQFNANTAAQFGDVNDHIRNARIVHFRAHADEYFVVNDALYHSCFVKFYAGTDNRAKNTYYYTDPSTLLVRFMQDDLDTTIKTNNVGQNRKPYYVEEHDWNVNDYFWQGEASGFYNLLEEAFETEMTSMMYNMMAGMTAISGSVMKFHEDHLLYTQDYFPAIAYNMQAQNVYEVAAIAQANGQYENGTVQAITQSVGSQRWSEYQWLVDRIMYISSWCEYGEFAGSSSASGGLSWSGTGTAYNFKLTPAKWLYPRIGSDSGNEPASISARRVRVQAGQQFSYKEITTQSDSRIYIRGINYYLDIGDFNISVASDQTTFDFSGRKLQKININPTGNDVNVFNPSSITISGARNIKEFVVRNVTTLRGSIDLSMCTRLEKIDLRGSTGVTELNSSDNSALKELRLPASIRTLQLVSPENLTIFTMDSAANLSTLSIVGNSGGRGLQILGWCVRDGAQLQNLTLSGETWEDPPLATVQYISDVPNKDVSVNVVFVNNNMSFALKLQLMQTFGNIDDPTNPVHATYTIVPIESASISGATFMSREGQSYQLNIVPIPATGNNFKSVLWELNNDVNATISQTGVVTVLQVSDAAEAARGTVSCTITLNNDTVLTPIPQKVINFYVRQLQVGDFVFSDGSYSVDRNGGAGLTVVGRCFYINPNDDFDRRMVTMSQIANVPFGLRSGVTLADGSSFPTRIPNVPGFGNTSSARTGIPISSQENGVPSGKSYTFNIITYRNVLMADQNVNLPIPEIEAMDGSDTAWNYLTQVIIQAGLRNIPTYVYPAASKCYAFEPTVREGEVLDTRFKAKQWYLPVISELDAIATVLNEPTEELWSCLQYTNGGLYHTNKSQSYREGQTSYGVRACCVF